jgi:F-type H+-transporting ATPase subunit b
MINIDGSLFIQIANFLLIMILLNYVLYRPIRGIVKERRAKFEAFESNIGDLTERADGRVKEIETKLVEAKREGFSRKDEIKGTGVEEEKKIIEAASTQAEAEVQKVQDQIKGEITQARDQLKAEIDMFSKELAEKVLGRSLS